MILDQRVQISYFNLERNIELKKKRKKKKKIVDLLEYRQNKQSRLDIKELVHNLPKNNFDKATVINVLTK